MSESLRSFFEDIKSYPRLSTEEEKDIILKKEQAFLFLQDAFLSSSKFCDNILSEWKNTKKNNKSSNKLAEDYGNIRFQAQQLTNQIEINLKKAQNAYLLGDIDNTAKYIKKAGISKTVYINIVNKSTNNEIKSLLNNFYYYRDLLVKANFLLVINYAKSFNIHGVPFEDLLQEGNLGLIRAAEKFNSSRGEKFSTYATWWIRQSFISLVKKQSKTIRLPSHIHNNLTKLKKAFEKYEFDYNKEPSTKELSQLTGIPVDAVEKLVESRIDPISLETYIQDGSLKNGRQKQLKDMIGDTIDYEQEIFSSIKKTKLLEKMSQILEPEEKIILQMKFGIDTLELSFQDISTKTGLNKSTVKYLYNSALEKLKKGAIELGE